MRGPIAIATWDFGEAAARRAYDCMAGGRTALEGVEAGINLTELDATVNSVGCGGLPNADGVVEMDAAIMDGPEHRAGAVAALRSVCQPISVARKVMERSRHVMLVGQGALDFALANGFEREETLTAQANRAYQDWIARGRPRAWLGGAGDPVGEEKAHDTIGLAAMDSEGRLAVGCSTSGLAFKDPGRVGDSPLIGAGLYVDQAVGAATATGVGELIMRFALSHTVVEIMRRGVEPEEACQGAIRRIVASDPRYAGISMSVIALRADGEIGAGTTRLSDNPFPYGAATPEGVGMRHARWIP